MLPPGAQARLGRYELLARLATGGMGEIFLARLEGAAGFEKLFVIKRILPHLAGDLRFRAMLIAEAQLASMMTHANICHVYELGETDGQLYIVMEYLEGVTMLPLLRKLSKDSGTLELGFIGGVIQQATDALHYAHELTDRSGDTLGIVHRDVTPSNIFLNESGVVKLLDFGIAKVKNASAHTQTGTIKGKYAYMAPEQLRGASVDRRADVFALGVVLYEMLALRRLFQRKTDYLTFRAVMEQPIIDVRRYRPDCPAPLAAALVRALDRDPANRFDTARQLGSAVLDAIGPLKRPWTQGEIGDFVRVHFAHDFQKRSAQIASAVQSSSRQTMPLIAQPEEETEVDGSVPEFPPVDSPLPTPPADEVYPGPSGEHAWGDAGLAPQADPLRGSTPQPIVVVSRRSVVWPLVAFAMVGVAGGALFLVWRQMENQSPPILIADGSGTQIIPVGSNEVVVRANVNAPPLDRPSEPPAKVVQVEEPPPRRADRPATAGSADRSNRTTRPPTGRRLPAEGDPDEQDRLEEQRRNERNKAVVNRAQAAVDRCAQTHGKPPADTQLVLTVAPVGRVESVVIHPQHLDKEPLGTCIKRAFQNLTFPRGDGETLRVNLRNPA